MGTCPIKCRTHIAQLEHIPESVSLEDQMVVSLYNYPSHGVSGHSIHTGERLTVISDDGDFCMVRSTTTDQECYIPSDYTAKVIKRWLFIRTCRMKAEELLSLPNNHTGAFMIRESETEREFYSLSILWRTSSNRNSVKHYRICRLQNGFFYISPRLTFPSLDHLVEHYSESADGLCCVLKEPCFIQGSESASEVTRLFPRVIRRPTLNWRDVSSSMIFRKSRVDSQDSLVSEGLREAISSYLFITDAGCEDCAVRWNT
ncbi:src-like-adapter 2 isoform X1 [Osmerus mordax]|uniref:src-like-adapter 2 isoform X1 n=1 Tax=Osmerus mordax TaxID=8014 RepID=UPI00350F2598